MIQIPQRVWIGFMIFGGILVNYTMRVNVSVNIIAMVPVAVNGTVDNNSLNWSPYEKANILGGYSWGYIVTCICGGTVAEVYGPKAVVIWTTLASAGLTFLSPVAAKTSPWVFMAVRILLGFSGGFIFPSSQVLISQWAVPFEKGKFFAATISGTLGTVVAWSLCGVIIDYINWEWAFYMFGITAVAYTLACWYLVFDSPEKHPRITHTEKKYIIDGIAQTKNKVKMAPPYYQIMKSVPVWSLVILCFGNIWGIYFVLNAAPMFISNVLGYNIASTAVLSSAIYLIRSGGCIVFGFLSDFIVRRNLLTVRVLRKSFCGFSHILPGLLIFALTLTDSSSQAIALMIVSMAINSAVVVTNVANALDLSPNYTGTVFGISNGISSIAGILTPLVVAHFTKNDETSFEAWQPVFYTGGSVYIGAAIIFILFGSTEIQKWNGPKERPDDVEVIKESILNE